MTVVMMQICIAGAPQFSGNRPATHSLFVQDFNLHNCLKSNIGSWIGEQITPWIRFHRKPDLSDEKEILMLKIASIHEYFCKKLINITKAKIFNFYCDNGKKLYPPNPAPLTC